MEMVRQDADRERLEREPPPDGGVGPPQKIDIAHEEVAGPVGECHREEECPAGNEREHEREHAETDAQPPRGQGECHAISEEKNAVGHAHDRDGHVDAESVLQRHRGEQEHQV